MNERVEVSLREACCGVRQQIRSLMDRTPGNAEESGPMRVAKEVVGILIEECNARQAGGNLMVGATIGFGAALVFGLGQKLCDNIQSLSRMKTPLPKRRAKENPS